MSENQPPVDPSTLPDPEDITLDDVGQAPPRPEHAAPTRRFGGTHKQIRGALTFYRICAYLTGIMLLLLVAEMIAKYGFGVELYAGGQYFDGGDNVLALAPEGAIVGGANLSLAILIAHGWMYVIYLVACFRLWSLMRWHFWWLLAMAGGGVVPFLSFYVEGKMVTKTRAELDEHPEGLRRY